MAISQKQQLMCPAELMLMETAFQTQGKHKFTRGGSSVSPYYKILRCLHLNEDKLSGCPIKCGFQVNNTQFLYTWLPVPTDVIFVRMKFLSNWVSHIVFALSQSAEEVNTVLPEHVVTEHRICFPHGGQEGGPMRQCTCTKRPSLPRDVPLVSKSWGPIFLFGDATTHKFPMLL